VVGGRHRGAGPRALAGFYSELLGWPVGHEEPGTAIVAAPQGSVYLVFQQADGYQAPVWPPAEEPEVIHPNLQARALASIRAAHRLGGAFTPLPCT
jgi:hypothetical protein